MLNLVPYFHKYCCEVQSDWKMPDTTQGTTWHCEWDSSYPHPLFLREAERFKEPCKSGEGCLTVARNDLERKQILPKRKPGSWFLFSFPLYFVASAMRMCSRVEIRVSVKAQRKAAWLGVISFTSVCLVIRWVPRAQGMYLWCINLTAVPTYAACSR